MNLFLSVLAFSTMVAFLAFCLVSIRNTERRRAEKAAGDRPGVPAPGYSEHSTPADI